MSVTGAGRALGVGSLVNSDILSVAIDGPFFEERSMEAWGWDVGARPW